MRACLWYGGGGFQVGEVTRLGGGRYIIGRREKWPEKVGRREKSGRKCREEGENEMLGVGRLQ